MEAAPRWRRRREARPGELLEQALRLFAERGVEATTLDEVARRAGVTKGTIYHYFASKDDLLDHLVSDLALPALATLPVAAESGGDDPAERLERMMRQHFTLLTTTPVGLIPRLLARDLGGRGDLAQRLFTAVGQHVFALYGRTIAAGQAAGRFIAVDPAMGAQLCALPIVARSMIGDSRARPMLGADRDFIDAHCLATRRWLGSGPS